MPTITVKVTEQEKADVQARAGDAGISALVRRALDLERDGPDLQDQIAALWVAVKRLEQIAGL